MQDIISSPEVTGIPSTDLVILTCIRNSLADIKKNPYILNYVFKNLLQEPLLTKYGQNELMKIKKFFVTYDLPVIWGSYLETVTPAPFISVKMMSSNENKSLAGLGDENMPTMEEELETAPSSEVYAQPYALSGSFTPQYTPSTGVMTIPDTLTVFPGEFIQSNVSGNIYEVLSVTDATDIVLQTNIVDDFTNATVVFQDPNPSVDYYFGFFDQIFEINCVTNKESAPLFWLSNLVQFLLIRYRRDLFEKYNLSLSRINVGKQDTLEVSETNVQLIYQPIIFECRVEFRVLKDISQKIRGIDGTLNAEVSGDLSPEEILDV